MQLLKILKRPAPPNRYPDEVQKITKELERQGFTATEDDVIWAYAEYSEDHWACSWLSLDYDVVTVAQAAVGVREYLILE